MVHPGAPNFQWWGVIACLLTDFLVGVVRELVASIIVHPAVHLIVHLTVHLAVHLAVQLAVLRVEFAGVDGVIWVMRWVVVCMVEWGVIRCTTAC
jgi:hypothetical protein